VKSCLNATTLTNKLSFADFVTVAGKAGFAGVEVRLGPIAEMAKERGIEGVRAFFAEAGVAPAHCGLSASPIRPDADYRAGLKQATAECELARALEIPTAMLVMPFRRDQGENDPDRLVQKVREVAVIAEDYGIGITLEFLGLHPPADLRSNSPTTLGQTLDFAERVGRPNVGVLIDSYHWYLGGSQTADLARIKPGMPLFVHINDAPPGPVETLTDPMRVLPGEGVLDLTRWLSDIRRATGYDGYVSLELFNDEIRQLDPTVAAQRCYRAADRLLASLPS
jgi:2-keto-myo-inositol isomerase